MFTGLTEMTGKVLRIERKAASACITVEGPGLSEKVRPGDSVAVNGACLTVSGTGAGVAFDVVSETLSRTTLGTLRSGDAVNIELALKLGDRLGGHLVQGHVDGVATVRKTEKQSGQVLLTLTAPAELIRDIVPKGSVTVDGVSLTVVSVTSDTFSVALVPFTLEKTTLGKLSAGGQVNIETDIIGKYVRNTLERSRSGSISETFLREHGFD